MAAPEPKPIPREELVELLATSHKATPGPFIVSSEKAVEWHRKLCGEASCPEGVRIIERVPQAREEAMEIFFHAVAVG